MKLPTEKIMKYLIYVFVGLILWDIAFLIFRDKTFDKQLYRIISIIFDIGLLLFCIPKFLTWIISLGFDLVSLIFFLYKMYQYFFLNIMMDNAVNIVIYIFADLFVLFEIAKYIKEIRNGIHY